MNPVQVAEDARKQHVQDVLDSLVFSSKMDSSDHAFDDLAVDITSEFHAAAQFQPEADDLRSLRDRYRMLYDKIDMRRNSIEKEFAQKIYDNFLQSGVVSLHSALACE